jgi:hypothetical protein
MDGSRFDTRARSLAGARSRRSFLGGVLGLGAGLAKMSAAGAACPPGQVSKRGRCLCKLTGRPPVGGACPCPAGLTDTGDGLGCLACRVDADCLPTGDPCQAAHCVAGACRAAPVPGGAACVGTDGVCCTGTCCPAACDCLTSFNGTFCYSGRSPLQNFCTDDEDCPIAGSVCQNVGGPFGVCRAVDCVGNPGVCPPGSQCTGGQSCRELCFLT